MSVLRDTQSRKTTHRQKKKIQIPYGVLKLSRIELQKNVEEGWAAATQKEDKKVENTKPSTQETEDLNIEHEEADAAEDSEKANQPTPVTTQPRFERYNITRFEIEECFKYFALINNDKVNAQPQYKKRINPKDVKEKLMKLWPNIGPNEVRSLLRDPNFTLEKLCQILDKTPLTNDDCLREAFKVFDPDDTGFVDLDHLAAIMTQMGYNHTITADDVRVLLVTADKDGDGMISFEDFKNMTEPYNKKKRSTF
ncbi:calcium-binding protein CML28 [Acrasis kona]|uniref:Calcium-binding protein CML28 n=1 Tax=Acrasis kona TaxID=1008807 RepID=A0AAW2YTB9_9EUKA